MRGLQEIETAIQSNRKALFRAVGGKFDVMDAAAWQWAYDRHPDLQARDTALIREYVEAMHARYARQQAKAKARHQRRVREAAQERRTLARAVAAYQMAA